MKRGRQLGRKPRRHFLCSLTLNQVDTHTESLTRKPLNIDTACIHLGDNQGVKFLRRFKQLLNPAQVFDLISTGPRLGLRLFRHFDPFRILVCSGDGSVGWVLSEIDKLDMHVCFYSTVIKKNI